MDSISRVPNIVNELHKENNLDCSNPYTVIDYHWAETTSNKKNQNNLSQSQETENKGSWRKYC